MSLHGSLGRPPECPRRTPALSPDLLLPATFVVAVTCAVIAVPAAARLAIRLRFHDQPGGYKKHKRPTPYLGGLGVLSAFFVTLTVTHGEVLGHYGWVLGGVALLWAVGTYDDKYSLGPGVRVLIEVALAAVLWNENLGWHVFGQPVLDLFVTILWVVGLINAFNL